MQHATYLCRLFTIYLPFRIVNGGYTLHCAWQHMNCTSMYNRTMEIVCAYLNCASAIENVRQFSAFFFHFNFEDRFHGHLHGSTKTIVYAQSITNAIFIHSKFTRRFRAKTEWEKAALVAVKWCAQNTFQYHYCHQNVLDNWRTEFIDYEFFGTIRSQRLFQWNDKCKMLIDFWDDLNVFLLFLEEWVNKVNTPQ